MTIRKMIALTSIAALGFGITGCSTASKTLGLKKSAPNEFNILTKAPLIVPPEYSLRPPRAGEASAEDNYSQEAARQALVGNIDSAEPSQGEQILLNQAGALRANPEIRVVIDGQNSVERKTKAFSDRIMFWNNGQAFESEGQPLSAEEEARRLEAIQAATGGGQVTITRRPPNAKLPGL